MDKKQLRSITSKQILKVREHFSLTQEELAKRINTNTFRISHIERGYIDISALDIYNLETELKVSSKFILGLTTKIFDKKH